MDCVNDVFGKQVVIKRATIHSQSRMIDLTNVLAIQIEERDTDYGRIKTAL